MIGRGKFDRRIRFERASQVTESMGGSAPGAWALLAVAYAFVRFGTAQERREAAAENAHATATFRVLSNPTTRDVTSSDRIVFAGKPWNVTGIAPTGIADEIEFTATVAEG